MDVCSVTVCRMFDHKTNDANIVEPEPLIIPIRKMKTSTLHKLLLLLIAGCIGFLPVRGQWTLLNSGTSEELRGLHFADANNGMAVGGDSLILSTTDGGATWNPTNISGWPQQVFMTSPTTAYVSSIGPGVSYIDKTTDGGATWATTTLTNTFVSGIVFPSATVGYAAGAAGEVFKTTNSGASWISISTSYTNDLFLVDFISANEGWAAGNNRIIKTADGGLTWTSAFPFSADIRSIKVHSSDTVFIAGLNGDIYRTFNGGSSWSQNYPWGWWNNGNPLYTNDIEVIPTGEVFTAGYAATPSNGRQLNKSYDFAGSFVRQTYPSPVLIDTLFAIDFANHSTGYMAGSGGRIYKTTTQGSCESNHIVSRDWACKGDTFYLRDAIGAAWTTSFTTAGGQTVTPGVQTADTSFILYVEASTQYCNIYDTITFTVLYCDSIWPGDANADGIANFFDLFNLGIGYGATGPARPAATNNWQAQSCPDWSQNFYTFAGPNYKHADCDGNALIEIPDTLPLSQNYGLTHQKTFATGGSGVPIWISPNFDSLMVGDTGSVDIMLGDMSTPVDSIYGLAFSRWLRHDLDRHQQRKHQL